MRRNGLGIQNVRDERPKKTLRAYASLGSTLPYKKKSSGEEKRNNIVLSQFFISYFVIEQ